MGYIYNLAQIKRTNLVGNDSRSAFFDLQNNTTLELAIGECLYLELEIDSVGANFYNGQTFFINFALFRLTQRSSLANFGTGWRIDITQPSPALLSPSITLAGANTTALNYEILGASINPTFDRLKIDIILFATNDTQNWIGSFNNNNTARFLQPIVANNPLTQNTGQSAYRNNNNGLSYFEIYGYETTNGSSPSSVFADPFIRMPTNPSVKQISKPVRAKWYDTHFNNAQSWTSPTTMAYNAIDTILITPLPSQPPTTLIKRQKYPTLTDTIDLNFEPQTAQFPRSLNYSGLNYATITLLLGTVIAPALIDRIAVRIVRVDNISNNTDFYNALQANESNIPLLDATAAPNWYDSGNSSFGSPTTVLFGAPTTVSFVIDGAKLQYKARYRLILMVYDTTTDFISTHISPELIADFSAPADIGTPVTNVRTYNSEHIDSNDVTLSIFERFNLFMGLDKTAYTGVNFDSELQLVELQEIQNNNLLNTWAYNFTPNASNLNSRISVVANNINELLLSFEQRAGYSLPLLFAPTTFIYRWKFTFAQFTANGTQSVTYQMDMFITVKPINFTRINGITFLNAADFDINIETPLAFICAADTEVVVKIEKNGAPDANLIGLMLQNILPNPPVYENAAYFSPVGLNNINSPIMQQVDVSFVGNFAFYRIDLTQIRGNNNFIAGALTYDI